MLPIKEIIPVIKGMAMINLTLKTPKRQIANFISANLKKNFSSSYVVPDRLMMSHLIYLPIQLHVVSFLVF